MKIKILLFFTSCMALMHSAIAQLQIGPGTSWRSDNTTYVVLNNTGIKYDAATTTLSNSFKFTGNADAGISGTSLPIFTNILLAKTGTARLILQRSFNLTQNFDFQGGLCDLNGFAINLGTNAMLINENENSRIMGSDGYVRIIADLNAPNNVNPGNLGAVLTSSQNLGSTFIYRGVMAQNILTHNSIKRYYDILPTNNTALNATLRFNYFDAELNGINETQLLLWKSPDNINWTEIGFDSRDAAANYVLKSGIADFSRWTLQLPAIALPVNFKSINARCDNGKVIITWKTAQEINSKRFNVERSTNGNSWQVIGTIAAAGYSSSEKTYVYTDINPLLAGDLYRIAAYDLDGRVQYSGILHSSCNKMEEIKIWPNPAHDIVFLSMITNTASHALINVYDAKGSLILTQKENMVPGGSTQLNINISKLLPGIYEMKVTNNNRMLKTFKLIKY